MSMDFGGSLTQVGVLILVTLVMSGKHSAWHTVRSYHMLGVLLRKACQGLANDEGASLLCLSSTASAGE